MSINQVPTGICDFLFRLMVSRKTAILRGLTPTFSQCTAAICAPRSDFARPKDEASRLPLAGAPTACGSNKKRSLCIQGSDCRQRRRGAGSGRREGRRTSEQPEAAAMAAGHKTRLLLRGRRRSADILVQIDGRQAWTARTEQQLRLKRRKETGHHFQPAAARLPEVQRLGQSVRPRHSFPLAAKTDSVLCVQNGGTSRAAAAGESYLSVGLIRNRK